MSFFARLLITSLGLTVLLSFGAERASHNLYAQKKSTPTDSAQKSESKFDRETDLKKSANLGKNSSKSVSSSKETNIEKPQEKTNPKQEVFFKGDDDQYFPVPNLSLDQVLDYLKQKQAVQPEHSPKYAVSSVSLSGKVEDDRAILDVQIVVLINEANSWVRIPLKLNESIFLKTSYSGDGESSPGGFNRNDGYLWWFRGKGTHKINLTLSISLKQQLPSRRLQLLLPQTAVSNLQLTIPLPQISLEVPTGVAVSKKAISANQSLIEMFGLGDQLDLSWQPIPDEKKVETVLQAETLLTTDFTSDSVLLNASQSIKALTGSFQSVKVKLPEAFRLLDVKCESYKSHKVTKGNLVEVSLTEPTVGPIELQWTLETDFPEVEGHFLIDGFEIDRAKRQTGIIDIQTLDGYRIFREEGQNRFVYQIKSNQKDLDSSYRFLKQPFRLPLKIERVKPYFSAKPFYLVQMFGNRAELEARVQINVFQGALDKVSINWPHRIEEGWELELMQEPSLTEAIEIDQGQAEKININLLKRSKGEFEVTFRARRPVIADEEPFSFTLPEITAPSLSATSLVIANDFNVVTDLTPSPKTQVLSSPLVQIEKFSLPAKVQALRKDEFQIQPGVNEFSAVVSIHSQEIIATSAAQLEMDDSKVRVEQEIKYLVEYEPLSEIRLLVPLSLKNHVDFYLDDEQNPLVPTWISDETDPIQKARLSLRSKKLGPVKITAIYLLPQKSETEVSVPLIRSDDVPYSESRFELSIQNQEGAQFIEVESTDTAWQQQLAMNKDAFWRAVDPEEDINLKLKKSDSRSLFSYAIRQAWIHCSFDLAGLYKAHAQYEFPANPQTLSFRMPENANVKIDEVWWNEEPVTFNQVPGNSTEYQLNLPQIQRNENSLNVLTIKYHSTKRMRESQFSLLSVSAAEFSNNLWVEKTMWKVSLPNSQHLFTIPRGYTPQFRWKNQGVFWSREFTGQDEIPVALKNVPLESNDSIGMNSYQFYRLGPATSLEFHALSRSMIVFIGAGTSLLLGFILMSISPLRSVLVLLIMMTAVSAVALWYTAPVEVLLQPAIFGLLLAVVAALINGTSRKRRESKLLAMSAHSDFIPPPSYSERIQPSEVDPEDITAVRPGSELIDKPVSSSEAGANR
ncbi:hypothetical protein [Gimesia aquarii]|uniref:Uncharacterized protein n=1 Tax=Gimesia aquarii TaxID=2527964 RepID=A0A517X2N5_9PLAN|nr:hypothetical protein [Gimesia aquarii]QDU11768.1 hypothetical protein V202x_51920 [Gimesia aquarii]